MTDVVIASGDNAHLVDALSAGPLATARGAPILLTQEKVLPAATAAEIKRIGATRAYVIGTVDVIGTAVETALRAAGITTIVRLGGADRYATAVAVSKETFLLGRSLKMLVEEAGMVRDIQISVGKGRRRSALVADSISPLDTPTPVKTSPPTVAYAWDRGETWYVTNTGPASGTAFTTATGTTVTTSKTAVNYTSGKVTVGASNVVFTNCVFHDWVNLINGAYTGIVFDHCEFDVSGLPVTTNGSDGAMYCANIIADNHSVTFRNCKFHGAAQHLCWNSGAITVDDSYFYDMRPCATTAVHSDVVLCNGPTGGSTMSYFRRNWMVSAEGAAVSGPFVAIGDWGQITNITFDGNLTTGVGFNFFGATTATDVNGVPSPNPIPSNIIVTNNRHQPPFDSPLWGPNYPGERQNGVIKWVTMDAATRAAWANNYTTDGVLVPCPPTILNATVPLAPTGMSATAGTSSATVMWTDGAQEVAVTGGSPITGYTITPYIGATAQTARTFTLAQTTLAAPNRSAAVTGLTAGTAYTFRIAATNVLGTGANSAATNSVTPTGSVIVAPGTPTAVSAVGGAGSATVSFTPGSTGGATVTYTAANSAETYSGIGSASPVTVSGLPAGTYQFKVRGTNSAGASAWSALSSVVTVTAGSSITHGSQINTGNVGFAAYYDPTLGRNVQLSDLQTISGVVAVSDFIGTGGTLSKKNFTGTLLVDVDNVTIRACRFVEVVSGYPANAQGWRVEWCTWEAQALDECLHYDGYTAYRCLLQGGSDGAKINGNCELTECYIRVWGLTGDHNDGVQNYAGSGPVLVQRCNIDCRPVNGGGGPNGALFAADGADGLMTWNDNWVAGGTYVIRCQENCTYECQGNQVLNNSWVYGPAMRAIIPASNVNWGTVRPNTIVDAAGNYVSTLAAP